MKREVLWLSKKSSFFFIIIFILLIFLSVLMIYEDEVEVESNQLNYVELEKKCTRFMDKSITQANDTCSTRGKKRIISFLKKDWLPTHNFGIYKTRCDGECIVIHQDCKNRCKKLSKKYEQADVLVGLDGLPAPCKVRADQLTLWFTMESPSFIKPDKHAQNRRDYDLMMSYQRDTDIIANYVRCDDLPGENGVPPSDLRNKDPKFLVAYLSSNCKEERDNKVRELMKYINVHSFGKCLHNADYKRLFPDCDKHQEHWSASKNCIVGKFMFYLAFENSVYEDYVTEKLMWTFETGTVPIYFGAHNVDLYQPGNHSLIKISSDSNMKDLAFYLQNLANNPQLYAQYFSWQHHPLSPSYQHLRHYNLGTSFQRMCDYFSKDD